MIGKDILRHHAIYWPIILHALGLTPPVTIFAHGWWMMKDVKMSKSKGNIVDPEVVILKFGQDVFRYFLLREVPFGLDGTYSEKALVGRLNSDLANDLGNLLHRSLTMIEKYFQGVVPECKHVEALDKRLISQVRNLPKKYFQAMDRIEFGTALDLIWSLINAANKYIEQTKPWELFKQNRTECLAALTYNLASVLRTVAILTYPFIPTTSLKMLEQLGLKIDLTQANFQDLLLDPAFPSGTKIKKGKPLFPRIL